MLVRNLVISIALVVVMACAMPAKAQTTDEVEIFPEYFGLVCESEMLARAIGEGFSESGPQGFGRRAGIAIGNGCHYIGPYTLPPGITTPVTSWIYRGYQLTLCVSRMRNAQGIDEVIYGYVISEINTT